MSSITDILKQLEDRQASSEDIVRRSLAKLAEVQDTHSIATLTLEERAIARAKEQDERRTNGKELGRLAGVPFIAKDNFLTFGGPTSASSNMLRTFNAPYQATAIERLEAEGAICIAKANLDAFAHGSSTENSDFGPTKNPVDTSRVPGGSSGGSAAAVALEVVPFALGTDTGGSIRQPASFCGVVGLKPTYGLVSRYGVVAMASSTDTIGVLATTASDAALVLDCMAGEDHAHDSTTLPTLSEGYLARAVKPLRIGLIKEYMTDAVAPDVRQAIQEQVEKLRTLGHTVEKVSLPLLPLALAIYYIVVPAEISSNLSRYDGVRFGYHVDNPSNLDELFGKSRDEGFNAENKRRILIGTYVLSSGYYDAYYQKAQKARTLLIKDFAKAFSTYDVLIGPVTPTTAFPLGANTADPLQMYLADIMTVSASLAGLPAISVPAGIGEDKLPIGLQLIGPQRFDPMLLGLAKQLQEA